MLEVGCENLFMIKAKGRRGYKGRDYHSEGQIKRIKGK